MSTEQKRAIVALTLVVETCNAVLNPNAISEPSETQTLEIIHRDLVSLLSLLYAAVTKVSLVLKPAKPAYQAALAPLKDLSDHSSALFHCSRHFLPEVHGATLVQEIEFLVKDAMEAIRALAQCFLDVESSGIRTASGQAGDEYMVRTATAHTVLKRDVSTNNLAAVRKRWSNDAASLEDGYREVGEMIEDADSLDEEEDGFDDGWDELGLGKSQQLDPDELERTKKIHGILRLVQPLHKRILTDVLPLSSLDIATLDALASESRALLCASDELVAALYAPQNAAAIRTELTAFRAVLGQLELLLNPLESQLANLTLGSSSAKKWIDTCFAQVYKAVDVVLG
ncbi:hypothetical protein HMN09_00077100 [Mycena chlorophos]|uniref:Grap2 and cyclin-D-interacting-domain-containing protein n=1 Tax=Mycena chlorophos TaxID=658473 RepID=A0A8H6TWF3_MYCCL|nr:hypothetical protein HMN09_00077100 [Mycena chlorophos]